METLENEVNFFIEHLSEMLKNHEGEYVCVQGTTQTEYRSNFEDALTLGYETFGIDKAFLVRQVSPEYQMYGKHGKPHIVPSNFKFALD